jgi:hypothetical protein
MNFVAGIAPARRGGFHSPGRDDATMMVDRDAMQFVGFTIEYSRDKTVAGETWIELSCWR